MERYQKLLIAARYYLLGREFQQASDALEVASHIHTGFRKDGVTPEFMHQVQIFHYLRTLENSLMCPEETYIAAFLHDSIEDYPENRAFILGRGYSEEAYIALELLDKNGKTTEGYYTGIANNAIASVVKLADRAHNLSTMTGTFSHEKQLQYMQEVEEWFMPMIKQCRRGFPSQEPFYENAKHVLNIQLDLLDVINEK